MGQDDGLRMQQLIILLMRDAELFAASPARSGRVKEKESKPLIKTCLKLRLRKEKPQRRRILKEKWDFFKGSSKEKTQILLRVG